MSHDLLLDQVPDTALHASGWKLIGQHRIAKIGHPGQSGQSRKGGCDPVCGCYRIGAPDQLRPASSDLTQTCQHGAGPPTGPAIGPGKSRWIFSKQRQMPSGVERKHTLDVGISRDRLHQIVACLDVGNRLGAQHRWFPVMCGQVFHEIQCA